MNDSSKQFQEELKALLKKYDAEISLEESSRGYCGSTFDISIWAYTKYDDKGNMIRDCINLNLGIFFNGD